MRRLEPEPWGRQSIARIVLFWGGPLIVLLVLCFGGLAASSGCQTMGCGPWSLAAAAAGLVAGLGLLAMFGGEAWPHAVWIAASGVGFGRRAPGPFVPWEELTGPVEPVRWGVVPIVRRDLDGRLRVAGVVTRAHARSIVLDPSFRAAGVPPWAWESLGLEPPSFRARSPDEVAAPVRFPLREAAVRRRRGRVLMGFTAPALTAAMVGLSWTATSNAGVALAIVGGSLIVWDAVLRRRSRADDPPEALWVTPEGVAFEPGAFASSSPPMVIDWGSLTVFPVAPAGRERYYLRCRADAPGTASAFVRLPEAAVDLVLRGVWSGNLPPRLSGVPPRVGLRSLGTPSSS